MTKSVKNLFVQSLKAIVVLAFAASMFSCEESVTPDKAKEKRKTLEMQNIEGRDPKI